MIKFQGHTGLSATDARALLSNHQVGGAFTPGVTAVRANHWLPRDVEIYTINHIRPAATGAGNSFALDTYDGTVSQASFSFANGDGTQKTTNYSPAATLTAASSSAIAQGHTQSHVLTGAASAAGSFAVVYQDAASPGLSYHAAGDGTSNFSVGAADEYISVYGGGTTGSTAEAAAQTPWPASGTLSNFAIRYTTEAATTYDCQVRVEGATALAIPLAAAAAGALVIDTTAVSITQDQRLCFGFDRTAGVGTLFVCVVVFTFEAS